MDGFDRTWYSVAQDAAFAAIAKARAERINAWARERGWSQIPLLSGSSRRSRRITGARARRTTCSCR
jgi:hypothetical protein